MADTGSKIGIISCSGEEIRRGDDRAAGVRRVLEGLRPQQTVTVCLPLFLAGEVGERRFASEHPTITVDGCSKLCAKRGTEQYSGQVSASLVVSDIFGDRVQEMPVVRRGTRRQCRRRGRMDRRRADRNGSRCPDGLESPAGKSGIRRRRPATDRVLCLRQSVAGRQAGSERRGGHGERSAIDFPASRKEGAWNPAVVRPTRCWKPCESITRLNRKKKLPTDRLW